MRSSREEEQLEIFPVRLPSAMQVLWPLPSYSCRHQALPRLLQGSPKKPIQMEAPPHHTIESAFRSSHRLQELSSKEGRHTHKDVASPHLFGLTACCAPIHTTFQIFSGLFLTSSPRSLNISFNTHKPPPPSSLLLHLVNPHAFFKVRSALTSPPL